MREALAIVMIISGYVVIYYRLMVRHYYEQHNNLKESTFGALFSLPPPGKRLSENGQKYAKRYWIAVLVLITSVVLLALLTDFSAWRVR